MDDNDADSDYDVKKASKPSPKKKPKAKATPAKKAGKYLRWKNFNLINYIMF